MIDTSCRCRRCHQCGSRIIGVDGRVVIVAEQVVMVADRCRRGDRVLDVDDRMVVVVADCCHWRWYMVVVVVHVLWRWCD